MALSLETENPQRTKASRLMYNRNHLHCYEACWVIFDSGECM